MKTGHWAAVQSDVGAAELCRALLAGDAAAWLLSWGEQSLGLRRVAVGELAAALPDSEWRLFWNAAEIRRAAEGSLSVPWEGEDEPPALAPLLVAGAHERFDADDLPGGVLLWGTYRGGYSGLVEVHIPTTIPIATDATPPEEGDRYQLRAVLYSSHGIVQGLRYAGLLRQGG